MDASLKETVSQNNLSINNNIYSTEHHKLLYKTNLPRDASHIWLNSISHTYYENINSLFKFVSPNDVLGSLTYIELHILYGSGAPTTKFSMEKIFQKT